MIDIVERLRELPDCHNLHGRVFRAVREAANEIERLRAEIVLLEATGAEAADEIERLREALRQFADCELHDGNCASLDVAAKRIRAIARAALGENGHD